MLQVTIPASELYDEKSNTFVQLKEQELQLEHSLISVSKWESKWKKPFLTNESKTLEETLDYIRCMTLNKNVDSMIYNYIPNNILREIESYIDDPMTATWFNESNDSFNSEIITSEVIYYWMVEMGIPFECQKWHLNRLITLIRIYSIKKGPQKKMSRDEILARNRELNEKRKTEMGTKG